MWAIKLRNGMKVFRKRNQLIRTWSKCFTHQINWAVRGQQTIGLKIVVIARKYFATFCEASNDSEKIQEREKIENRKLKACYFGCVIGSKHRKNPEKSNSSELERQKPANGSMTLGAGEANVTSHPATTARPVKISVVSHMSQRRHQEKRCCRIGYRAAKRKLFCNVDRMYSAKYRNMEHYARQRFQYQGTPSRGMQRLIHQFERFCIKPQLKGVFYKCCFDGLFTAGEKQWRRD